ncbi:hypothetical protein AAHA92_02423 [Salvia divinorum]|uniref:Uncharacterized protein n=1 Tax=Salvia divinorum TaxID=28513 RepID=A0ABD1IDX7_SALDI
MGIYENNLRTQGSGQSHEDVKELSFKQFSQDGIYPVFKFWDCWEILKDCPKFQPSLPNAPKRTRLGASGTYSCSTGGDTPDAGTSPDPVLHPRCPAGIKASKRKGSASLSLSSISLNLNKIYLLLSLPVFDESRINNNIPQFLSRGLGVFVSYDIVAIFLSS